jgi:hypothetical protein
MRTALLVVLLSSAAASAELPQLSLSGGWSTQVFAAREVDLVAYQDNLSLGRIAGSAGFVLGAGVVDLELAFAAGGVTDVAHVSSYAALELQLLQVGVAYRLPIFSWLQPYLQVSGGLDFATLTLGGVTRLHQTVITGSGTGLAGVQFVVRLGPARKRMPSLVFDLGAGGVLRPAVNFDAMGPREPASGEAIATSTVNVGSMPLSGFTARLQLGLRF